MKANAVWVGLAIAVSTSAGCAYETMYERGDEYAMPQESGPPVASYGVPTTDPKGSVTVISLGAENLAVAGGQTGNFLHVRIAAENRSDDVVWSLNPNDQTLGSAAGSVSASFAQGSTGGPVVTLPKGQHGYLDVYYPAPAPGGPVTLAWKVHRGDEVVPGSTAFDRVSTPDPNYALYEPVYGPNVYVGLGMGYWWWPDSYLWWGNPFWWYYPHYWGYHGYWGPRYYGGYGGYRGGYYGGHYAPGGNWRGAGGYHGSGGGTYHSAPSGGHGGGGGGWRGGGHR